MQKLLKVPIAASLSALAMAATAPAVQAQAAFNFNTTGYFTTASPECTQAAPGSLTVVCNDPTPGSTLALTFIGQETNDLNFVSGSTVQLGTFEASGQGSYELGMNELLFTLVINQTLPTTGSESTEGYITGSINRTATTAGGGLLWSPTEFVNIDAVTYDLVFREDMGGIVIAAAGETSIEALGTVAPEPASMIMLGTGLFGLVGVAHRRRRKMMEVA